jgi:multidrug efflux pump subunit AcrA (membrane-fusion protein)
MSAVARIGVGEIPDVLLVPAAAVFTDAGQPVVYRFEGRRFVAVPIEIVRRGRDQVAVKAALDPGDRVSMVQPPADGGGGGAR